MELLYNFFYNKIPEALEERHKIENVNIKLDNRYKITSTLSNINVRFNHKFYCPDIKKGVISRYEIQENNKKISIPIFIKFKKNIYGTQFHFKNKKDLSRIIENIIYKNI